MVIKLRFIPIGQIDPVKLQATINTTLQAMITGGTLLQTTDSGSISLIVGSNDSHDSK